jgi:DNA ligase D-like protein (predicted 3'-phosphoesterase)
MGRIKFSLICLTFLTLNGFYMSKKEESLKNYKKRRDFAKTTEPEDSKINRKIYGKPLFVVQEHDASHLHYDFRLEINGVLKSWAIPKGPSMNPDEKRLALPTEDHPMSYANFEGIIPEGEYGAGTVMVWDIGTYKNIKISEGKLKPIEECLKDGQIEVRLDGKKLHGGFVMIRTNFRGKESWLFKKMIDEEADNKEEVLNKKKSVLTGRTLNEIAKSGAVYEE